MSGDLDRAQPNVPRAARAVETLLPDLKDFLQEHWLHLRAMNPSESIFAEMR